MARIHPAASEIVRRMSAAMAPPNDALFIALEDVDAEGLARALQAGASPDARCRLYAAPGFDDPMGSPLDPLGFPKEDAKSRLAKAEAARGPVGDTALIQACSHRRLLPMIQTLLRAGADPNLANGHGVTPLMALARRRGDEEARMALGMLLGAGARLDDQDAFGCSALIHAGQGGAGRMLLALLEAGADPRLSTDVGAQAENFVNMSLTRKDYVEVEDDELIQALRAREKLLCERDAIESESAPAPAAKARRI